MQLPSVRLGAQIHSLFPAGGLEELGENHKQKRLDDRMQRPGGAL